MFHLTIDSISHFFFKINRFQLVNRIRIAVVGAENFIPTLLPPLGAQIGFSPIRYDAVPSDLWRYGA